MDQESAKWRAWAESIARYIHQEPVNALSDDELRDALSYWTGLTAGENIRLRDEANYPGAGDPWADFLHHRHRVIHQFAHVGKTPETIARELSMDPVQVELISRTNLPKTKKVHP